MFRKITEFIQDLIDIFTWSPPESIPDLPTDEEVFGELKKIEDKYDVFNKEK